MLTRAATMAYPCSFTFMLIMTLVSNSGVIGASGYDYQEALGKSIMFYEGQRSGRLPSNQRANWRADSALKDGFSQGVDLVGGYYDAGDNVKFGLPMAFTITMLSWSVVEYGYQLASSGQLRYTLDAIKWGTDYLIKAHPEPEVLWGEVGDGFTDHNCWQRPEEMTTSRQAYRVDPSRPGSDLAGETAAAMAAASIAFRHTDGGYANLLLEHAKQLFTFADTHRGKYDSSISVARSFYGSQSGYADELLWSAMWLYEATSEEYYLNYVMENAESLGGTGWAMTEFSWDAKYAGVQVLASKILLERRGGDPVVLQKYQSKAEFFLCACLQKNNGYNNNVQRTPGGLMYWQSWNNMQFVTSASFLLSVYSDYLTSARQQLQCSSGSVSPSEMLSLVKSQVDYILGDNPRATSYMVGFGANYPQRVHHRGASIVSYKVNPNFVSCRGGYATWYSRSGGDPNVLVGALVGGPDQDDNYADDRENYEQSEPATYNNGPFVGVLARVHGGGTYNQLYPVNPAPSVPTLPKSPVNPSPVPSPVRGHPHSASILISQRMTSSWNFRGHTYYRYEASVKNNSPSSLQQLILSVTKLYGPVWGLTQSGENAFTFPQWLQSLPSGESLVFVYIHAAPEADISISSSKFV